MKIEIIITANGKSERMRGVSPLPKHRLYLGSERVYEAQIRILSAFGRVRVLTCYDCPGLSDEQIIRCEPTENRMETLLAISKERNVLICDCDILPVGLTAWNTVTDAIWYFRSSDARYCGLVKNAAGQRLLHAFERDRGAQLRASGLYFVKDVSELLARMDGDRNSIAAAMPGAWMVEENTFLRFGETQTYLDTVLRSYGK